VSDLPNRNQIAPEARFAMPDINAMVTEFLTAHGVQQHAAAKAQDLSAIVAAAIAAEKIPDTDDAKIKLIITQEFEKRPHMKDGAGTVGGASDRDLEITAFGPSCTLAAQAALVKKIGADAARARAAAWGSSLGSLRPGKSPYANGEGERRDKGERNPWSTNFVGSPEARTKRIAELFRLLGTRKCSQIAAAAGMDIAGRPLRQ
jgi:hypothetical protein